MEESGSEGGVGGGGGWGRSQGGREDVLWKKKLNPSG